jgi:hypothetical protein
MDSPVVGSSDAGDAVTGVSTTGNGVHGGSDTSFGVRATSNSGVGLRATSESGRAIEAQAKQNGIGVVAQSDGGEGVLGISLTANGVHGKSNSNFGVRAESNSGVGLRATSESGRAIEAQAKQNGIGVVAQSDGGDGVLGISLSGIGVHGKGGRLAGFFEGNVEVTGNIGLTGPGSDIRLGNADCAEDFDVCGAHRVEPGTVMVLGVDGTLFESQQAYDTRVAGVVSGAGDYKPAIVLDSRKTAGNRHPIALLGKVFCKVDAQFCPIEVGDLLTTSPTPGHAMVAREPARAFGTVIGKALRPFSSGMGVIPILVTLQ